MCFFYGFPHIKTKCYHIATLKSFLKNVDLSCKNKDKKKLWLTEFKKAKNEKKISLSSSLEELKI